MILLLSIPANATPSCARADVSLTARRSIIPIFPSSTGCAPLCGDTIIGETHRDHASARLEAQPSGTHQLTKGSIIYGLPFPTVLSFRDYPIAGRNSKLGQPRKSRAGRDSTGTREGLESAASTPFYGEDRQSIRGAIIVVLLSISFRPS